MGWIVVNGILAVLAFAGILGVMVFGFRWHARSEQEERMHRTVPAERPNPAPESVATAADPDAELAALVQRYALAATGTR